MHSKLLIYLVFEIFSINNLGFDILKKKIIKYSRNTISSMNYYNYSIIISLNLYKIIG